MGDRGTVRNVVIEKWDSHIGTHRDGKAAYILRMLSILSAQICAEWVEVGAGKESTSWDGL